VTNITFIYETSLNTKPKEKKVGGHGVLCPPCLKKWGGHVPRVPHQIAPMALCDYHGKQKKTTTNIWSRLLQQIYGPISEVRSWSPVHMYWIVL